MRFAGLVSLSILFLAGCPYITNEHAAERLADLDTDTDGDGFLGTEDCWDSLDPAPGTQIGGAEIHPGATDTWYDGIDQDCALDNDFDADGDGYVPSEHLKGDTLNVGMNDLPGGDCWDDPSIIPDVFRVVGGLSWEQPSAADVHPGAGDTWYDGPDQDCSGNDDFDQDGDGYDSRGYVQQDGSQGEDCIDGGDFDDANPALREASDVNPGAQEVWYDGTDDDCDDNDCDQDGDTWCLDAYLYAMVDGFQPGDCVDTDPTIHPGTTDWCDDVDRDCDGIVDEDDSADATSWYEDADADGFGNPGVSRSSCDQPLGHVTDATDCDDGQYSVNPAASERCATIDDDDCDAQINESSASDALPWYRDVDGDGWGDLLAMSTACAAPIGYVGDSTDCDDTLATIHPGTAEICNSVDDDCDGQMDEGVHTTFWADRDADGYGDLGNPSEACTQPVGFTSDSSDCDDSDAFINPGRTEICNVLDDDCDGLVDEGVRINFYLDSDRDGYGNPLISASSCTMLPGYVTNLADCNDANAGIFPGATETCNSLDDDCDGPIDEGVLLTWYRDADSDGYGTGTSSSAILACSPPAGYTANTSDCNDTVASIHPGAVETCNGLDDDCDAIVDDGLQTTWYRDDDGDGYGDPGAARTACSQPMGHVANAMDCDDHDATIGPGLLDVCDGMDNDCDGYADNGTGCPCDVYYYGGVAYMFCTNPLTWLNASSFCSTYDYDMLTIDDAFENNWVSTVIATFVDGTANSWWIGFNDLAMEGTWGWEDGSPVTYTNWDAGEPNNMGSEDCGQFKADATWNDAMCSNQYQAICEAD